MEALSLSIKKQPGPHAHFFPNLSPGIMGLGVLIKKVQEEAAVLLNLLCSFLLMVRARPIGIVDSGTVNLSHLI